MNDLDYNQLFEKKEKGETKGEYITRLIRTWRSVNMGVPLRGGIVLKDNLSDTQAIKLNNHIVLELKGYVEKECNRKPHGFYGENQEIYVKNAKMFFFIKIMRFDIRATNLCHYMDFVLLEAMNETYKELGYLKKNDYCALNRIKELVKVIAEIKKIPQSSVTARDVYEYQNNVGMHYSLEKIDSLLHAPTTISYDMYMEEYENDELSHKKMSSSVMSYDDYSLVEYKDVKEDFLNLFRELKDIRKAAFILKYDYCEQSNSNQCILNDELFKEVFDVSKENGELKGELDVGRVENCMTTIKNKANKLLDSIEKKGLSRDIVYKVWAEALRENYEAMKESLVEQYEIESDGE